MLRVTEKNGDEGIEVSSRFFGFLILGIALVLIVAVVLVASSVVSGGSESSGGVIFIGPFPIVFGSGPNTVWLVLIGIILAVLSIVLFLIMNERSGKQEIR